MWVLYLIAIIITRKRIALAINIMKVAGKAVSTFPSLFLVPFIKNSFVSGTTIFILFVFLYATLLIFYWIYSFSSMLATVGEQVSNSFSDISTSVVGTTFAPNW